MEISAENNNQPLSLRRRWVRVRPHPRMLQPLLDESEASGLGDPLD
jgi:hypothetical protein